MGAYYARFKLFSTLPDNIKCLNHDIKVFKPTLRDHLSPHFFYSTEKSTSIENCTVNI
jgi:hypothetical protein